MPRASGHPQSPTPNSIRVSKTVNGVEHQYYLSGSQIIAETWGTQMLVYLYDAEGSPIGMLYRTTSYAEGDFEVYWFEKNLQSDVVAIYNANGTKLAVYKYDAWGRTTVTYYNGGSSTNATLNPFRYRGYYYDTETRFYYLNSRYYDPNTGRFISADGFISTGQGIIGNNMFAYCGNNPVMRIDVTGEFGLLTCLAITAVAVLTLTLASCSQTSGPRNDLSSAPDLDISSADPNSYNCYGNGIGKQINANPTGYTRGDSTRKTFNAVKNDLGSDNVRELSSINDPIHDDEFLVALKCGLMDYHFIRFTEDGWYNKSGTLLGVYIDEDRVTSDVWYGLTTVNGELIQSLPMYNYETIYFAVKKDWDST